MTIEQALSQLRKAGNGRYRKLQIDFHFNANGTEKVDFSVFVHGDDSIIHYDTGSNLVQVINSTILAAAANFPAPASANERAAEIDAVMEAAHA